MYQNQVNNHDQKSSIYAGFAQITKPSAILDDTLIKRVSDLTAIARSEFNFELNNPLCWITIEEYSALWSIPANDEDELVGRHRTTVCRGTMGKRTLVCKYNDPQGAFAITPLNMPHRLNPKDYDLINNFKSDMREFSLEHDVKHAWLNLATYISRWRISDRKCHSMLAAGQLDAALSTKKNEKGKHKRFNRWFNPYTLTTNYKSM